ncbi:hypothetical protein XELAEV_18024834mg [Xenopus laevis]|uniref:Uncharacterized protein n=1 Tax=Xenopus laevis TaxID=8355 RepID=A0A974CYQ8_XENLA|nr:hypothetical protein XELAEV_18024834mg [Xenopus laevis]
MSLTKQMAVLPNKCSCSFSEKPIMGWLGEVAGDKILDWTSKFMKIDYQDTELIQNCRMELLLFICPFMVLVGAGCFMIMAKFFEKEKVNKFMNTPTTDVKQPLHLEITI